MKKTHGFTLIEILVVVVLFSLIGGIGASLFSSTLRGSNKANVINEIKQNGSHALGIIERYIRNSDEIISNCDGSELTNLILKNQNGSTTTFTFDLPNGVLKQTDTVPSSVSNLTNNSVFIDTTAPEHPFFICSADAATTIASTIKIHFVMRQGGTGTSGDQSASVIFDTTVATRNK